jgi:signal transduction histidine kinase
MPSGRALPIGDGTGYTPVAVTEYAVTARFGPVPRRVLICPRQHQRRLIPPLSEPEVYWHTVNKAFLGAPPASTERSALQHGPLAVECLALAGAVAVDVWWSLHQVPAHGLQGLLGVLNLAVGPAAAGLAVLRRLLPERLTALGWLTVFVSFVVSGLGAAAYVAGWRVQPQLFLSEMLALAVLVGAAGRRLRRWPQAVFPVCAGLAMVGAPLVRDAGSGWVLMAAPGAQMWGLAVAVGLLLRDADRRMAAELSVARTSERLALARDLHDLVIHYVTGIVVRTQAARVVASMGPSGLPEDQEAYYDEIEQAGGSAVKAMRHLVGMLREDASDHPANLRDAVLMAVRDDDRVRLEMPQHLDRLAHPPELATTVHRVVLESLTNARRHAPQATYVGVALRIEQQAARAVLVLDVVNDGVTKAESRGPGGFGLMGIRERVRAVRGTVQTGSEAGDRWRVTARLPLSATRAASPFLKEVSP